MELGTATFEFSSTFINKQPKMIEFHPQIRVGLGTFPRHHVVLQGRPTLRCSNTQAQAARLCSCAVATEVRIGEQVDMALTWEKTWQKYKSFKWYMEENSEVNILAFKVHKSLVFKLKFQGLKTVLSYFSFRVSPKSEPV